VQRNLLYNVFASEWSDEWRLNVKTLCRYAPAFNGRKLVMIKSDWTSHKPDVVEAAFADLGPDVEFRHFENDRRKGEIVGFIDTLAELASTDPDEITFYAHTKGTKYNKLVEYAMQAIRQWRNRMYFECLHDIDRIEEVLKESTSCGSHLTRTPYSELNCPWIFAGNFWWVRHDALFGAKNWRDLDANFWGVETYLAKHLSVDSAQSFYSESVDTVYLPTVRYRCIEGHVFEVKLDEPRAHYPCSKCSSKSVYVDMPDLCLDSL